MDAIAEPTTIATQAKKTASFILLLEDTTAKSTSQTAIIFFTKYSYPWKQKIKLLDTLLSLF